MVLQSSAGIAYNCVTVINLFAQYCYLLLNRLDHGFAADPQRSDAPNPLAITVLYIL